MAESLVLTETDGRVALLTLNRPRAHNALNTAVLASLDACIGELLRDGDVNAVVITGAGEKSFCAGADLDELADLDGPASRELLAFGQQVLHRIATARIPVIAAVNGAALGGGFELVLATTFPVLAESASLGLPEAGLGLIPGYGGTQRLPRLIGRASAAHLMLSGSRLSAQRAFDLGVTPIAPVARVDLIPRAMEVAHSIAARGPEAVSAILEALGTSSADVSGLAHETALAALANSGAESREGVTAFKERREPRFASRRTSVARAGDTRTAPQDEEA